MITIRDLYKKFGEKLILNGLNGEFQQGKVYGIVGANGAGKTTLFRCLAGLESYEGEIGSSLSPLKEYLGYLPAESYFLPKITGEEYIRLLLEARKKKVIMADANNIFDLPLKEYISSYSTGMKKKLGIMATLLQGNEVYILDEPYNGLDFQSSLVLNEIVHKLREQNKIVILSSHIFGALEDTCDSISLLKEGKFVLSAQKEDFSALKQQISKELVSFQIDGLFNMECLLKKSIIP